MAEEDECEGCAKVRRHPSEGYTCAVHPRGPGPFECIETSMDVEYSGAAVDAMRYLADPNIDYPIFRAANHDLVTIFGELDDSDPKNIHTTGWRLWCMSCGLKGERLYQDLAQARQIARGLRNTAEPRCKNPKPLLSTCPTEDKHD